MPKNTRIIPPDPTPAQLAAKSRKFKKATSDQRVEIVKTVRAKKEKRGKVSQATVTRVVGETVAAPPPPVPLNETLPPLRDLVKTHTTMTVIENGNRVNKRVPYLEHTVRTAYTPHQLARLA